MLEPRRSGNRGLNVPARSLPSGDVRGYVRIASLGDSATVGLGDPVDGSWRGWARILADSVANNHDVSFCNLARTGATTADVRRHQLAEALEHRPHLVSLIVGLNDTLRSTWDERQVRDDLLTCAEAITAAGAVLLTARFHDHSRVFGLPRRLALGMSRRIAHLNSIFDEIHDAYGGLRVDLAGHPGVYDREFWSVDRLHPSELGHRALAHEFAALLDDRGLVFDPPALELDGDQPGRLRELHWLVTEGVPWVGRRARDLGPAAARALLRRKSRTEQPLG
jgi:lysophospholipase L1-like esterase